MHPDYLLTNYIILGIILLELREAKMLLHNLFWAGITLFGLFLLNLFFRRLAKRKSVMKEAILVTWYQGHALFTLVWVLWVVRIYSPS